MDKTIFSIGGKNCLIYSAGQPVYLLIQPVDDHDWEVLDEQVTAIAKAVDKVKYISQIQFHKK